jgi:hypothetical protein
MGHAEDFSIPGEGHFTFGTGVQIDQLLNFGQRLLPLADGWPLRGSTTDSSPSLREESATRCRALGQIRRIPNPFLRLSWGESGLPGGFSFLGMIWVKRASTVPVFLERLPKVLNNIPLTRQSKADNEPDKNYRTSQTPPNR